MTTVFVWFFRTDVPPSRLAELGAVLDESERRRAGEITFVDRRDRFIAAHGAARMILGRHLGVRPDRFTWRPGSNGKPELTGEWAGVRTSFSSSAELTALAVAERPIGVDVQRSPSGDAAVRLARRYYPPVEAHYVAAGGGRWAAMRFTTLWSRKEACVKAHGGKLVQGLGLPVQEIEGSAVRDPDGGLPGPFRLRDLPAPAGFRAAVALEGEAPYRVARRTWSAADIAGA